MLLLLLLLLLFVALSEEDEAGVDDAAAVVVVWRARGRRAEADRHRAVRATQGEAIVAGWLAVARREGGTGCVM